MEEEGYFDEMPKDDEIPDLQGVHHGNSFDVENVPHLKSDFELPPIPKKK